MEYMGLDRHFNARNCVDYDGPENPCIKQSTPNIHQSMTLSEVRKLRLHHQQIGATTCQNPSDVISHLIAMQAQEFRHAKWAIGLRLTDATEKLVDKAFNDGAILRTHLMRPTWHFVAPEDIRWLLALTAPRVHAGNGPYYKKF